MQPIVEKLASAEAKKVELKADLLAAHAQVRSTRRSSASERTGDE